MMNRKELIVDTKVSSVLEVSTEVVKNLKDACKNDGQLPGIPTGFADLDRITTGLHKTDLIILASPPSMGKTALALNIASNASINQNVPTLIFSLEMSKKQLVNRIISSVARVSAEKMRMGELDGKDWDKIVDVLPLIGSAPLSIDDTPGATLAQIRSKCRKQKLDKGLGLVVIDYLQMMTGSGKRNDNRQQEISEISRGLKALARELDCPVIALSQLNRSPEARSNKRPMLSDLRESGAIEQDADLVMFIYRDEYYNPESEKQGLAEIIIAKQRNGATGTIELGYVAEQVQFVNNIWEASSNYQVADESKDYKVSDVYRG